jgi:aminobenzoyl-glutamate utilization protein A
MHACGHDAHASIGLGVLQTILESDFSGTLKLFFQPAEEGLRGGKALAQSPQLSDVDHLFAVHLGLGYSTGELVAGMEEMLASSKLRARFHGSAAHAGKNPEAGENAVQAMATAIQNLHAIPRHGDGASRVNVGVVEGGNALNIIPEDATIAIEVRGVTTEIAEYMVDRANRILDTAAKMHGCTVDTETIGEAPRVDSDRSLAAVVAEAAQALDSIDTVHEQAAFNASEDATHLMQAVNSVIGTDHPAGHHTPEFDVDERSIHIGVEMLSSAIERLDAE